MTRYVPFFGDRPVVTPGKRVLMPHVSALQKCVICGGRPCLRAVNNQGFCRDHVAEAFEAAKQIKDQAR